MSRINQPPQPIIPTLGRTAEATTRTAVAPQPQAKAKAQDGFQTAQAPARMVLNPEVQARAAAPEVLPQGRQEAGTPLTDQQLNAAVDYAFNLQFNGKHPPSADERAKWVWRARELAQKDGPDLLKEKLFTELNKAVKAGGTTPGAGTDPKAPVTEKQLNDAVDAAFKQQYNGTRTPTPELRDQWKAEAKRIAERDGTTEFLGEKVFSALNKAVKAGRTSPLPDTDGKAPVTEQQLNDAVDAAFKQQYNGTRTPTPELRDQWKAEAKRIAEKDGTTDFLGEKVFSALSKAVKAGRTSPLPETDGKAPVTEQQLNEAVDYAFKQQYNGTRVPTDDLRAQWKAEAKRIAEDSGTTDFLKEKLFTHLNRAVSAGQTSPLGQTDAKAPVTDKQLEDAVNAAFKQQFNGTHPPSANEMKAWKDEARKIAEDSGTTEFLAEKVFSALNKAAKQ
ncbi:hypothetical protein [Hyalangium sp.]|uniref:hypothetical protein n=1 Tax=Hyalangium sp. TaxID=2028555 RepID=UPI002D6D0B95|nr:hypothetical protein [Hyalangium sp.]HYI00118.1 hypothetical protein [Hyalangium sp.]